MKIAALIPARKQSRRLPDKNWREIGKRPLWALAAEQAFASGVCDHVVISTDDDRISHHGSIRFDKAIYIRQPNFPQTYNVMVDVAKHADGELWSRDLNVEAICILQPTSPLRLPSDISHCAAMFNRSVDAVVSVTEAKDDVLFKRGHANRLERLPRDVVAPNGAIFFVRTSVLREGGYWYGDHTYSYEMPKERSIDIDNELDLEMAQMAWAKLHGPGR